MLTQLLNAVFGSKNDREIKVLRPIVERINGLEAGLTPLSDQALADKTQEFQNGSKPEKRWTTFSPRHSRCAGKCPGGRSTCGISTCS